MAGFKNAILGGAETLIRSAIKSFGFITGVTGWRIAKNGVAEFNDIIARGTIVADGGDIVIDDTGIHVQGVSRKWDINSTQGFISIRTPDDGTRSQMIDAGLFLRPQTPTPINGKTVLGAGAQLFGSNISNGTDEQPAVSMYSPLYTGKPGQAFMVLEGQSALSATDNSLAALNANLVELNGVGIQIVGDTQVIGDTNFIGDTHIFGDFTTGRPRWVADFGTQNIANGAATTVIAPTSVSVNTGGMGVGGTVTIPSIDVWDIGCSFRFPSNTAGNRMARILLNGVELQSDVRIGVTGSFNTTVTITIKLLLQVGDQIQFIAYQNSGGVLALVGSGNRGWVMKELA